MFFQGVAAPLLLCKHSTGIRSYQCSWARVPGSLAILPAPHASPYPITSQFQDQLPGLCQFPGPVFKCLHPPACRLQQPFKLKWGIPKQDISSLWDGMGVWLTGEFPVHLPWRHLELQVEIQVRELCLEMFGVSFVILVSRWETLENGDRVSTQNGDTTREHDSAWASFNNKLKGKHTFQKGAYPQNPEMLRLQIKKTLQGASWMPTGKLWRSYVWKIHVHCKTPIRLVPKK